ncbi:MAG: hypothetical protein SOW84_01315 [Candidatus Faecousia sp.]|nr:hypothetical protein [Candidatus Faecousia sp.]
MTNSKAIRRQLLAAIAMVLVAAVALGSSTYAWFASNNTVSANMSSITATSDAAFLEIQKGDLDWAELTEVDFTEESPKELLPARYKSTSSSLFETAFAIAPDAATIDNTTVSDVSVDQLGQYVWKETVKIRAQSGTFNNLTVSTVGISKVSQDSGLISAGRILAVCGDKVQLWKSGEKVSGDTALYEDNFTTTDSVVIDLYFYYDGDDTNVFTNNMAALQAIKAAITFDADQVTA